MSGRTSKDVRLVLGASPKVDLLPPEVADRKKGAAIRRGMIVGVVGAVVIVAGGYAAASWQAIEAGVAYEDARAQTSLLLAQQNEFAEVRSLSDQLATVTEARQVGAMTEIEWKSFYQRAAATLPASMGIQSFDIDSASPTEALAESTVPGETTHAANVTFVAETPSLGSAQTWVVALKALPEYAGAYVTSIARREDGVYTVTVRLMLSDAAHTNRFAPPPAVEPEVAPTEEAGN